MLLGMRTVFLYQQKWKRIFPVYCLFKQGETGENRNQRVGYGRHGFDKDVQRNAHNILAGIADSIAGNGGFVSRGFLSVPFKHTAFNVLFGVVKGTAGIAHKDGARNCHNGGADQKTAHKFDAEQETANYRH